MKHAVVKEGELLVSLGGGYFGVKAARLGKECKARTMILDTNPDCAAREIVDVVLTGQEAIEAGLVSLIIGDAMEILFSILEREVPQWIIPAVPGHALGKVVKSWLTMKGHKVASGGGLMREVLADLPNRLVLSADEESGIVMSSYMPEGMRCQDNCSQLGICPVTKRKKPAAMYELLEFSVFEAVDYFKIFASRQFEGVGGVPGPVVKKTLEHLASLTPPYSLAIGTSCRCHGILSLFKVE
ncbi:MAG TPA: hypothetical protein G4O17_05010 [Dehalococcoidia bacterium]|jgi:hypothetical protein|nr:hypothetical protein [Dehalococcoidia bacterium]